jgi:hypothetical protein
MYSKFNEAYGLDSPLIRLIPRVIVSRRNPTARDKAPIGQQWVNQATNTSFWLTSIVNNLAVWATQASVLGALNVGGALTVGTGITVATGGVTVTLGGAAITGAFVSDGGTFTINSGVNAINISADAAVTTVNIGTGAAVVKTISIGGTGNNVIAIANTQTGGSFSLGAAMTTGTISIGGTGAAVGVFDLAPGTGAQAINIGAGAGVKTITVGGVGNNVIAIGNTQLAGSFSLGAAMTTGTISIGGVGLHVGNFDLAPGTGAQTVAIANSTGVKTINIGSGVSGNTISLGNGANTVAQVINLAGGASGANSTVNILSGNKTAGVSTLNLGTGTGAKVVHIADGAGANVVTLGSTNGASQTNIQAGTLGLNLGAGGLVAVAPAVDTQATPTAASTLNGIRVGRVIFTGFTTASAAAQAFTITCDQILATSGVFVHVANFSAGNDCQMSLISTRQAVGSVVVHTINAGTQALDANVVITFWIIS